MSRVHAGSRSQSILASEKSRPIRFAPDNKVSQTREQCTAGQRTFARVHDTLEIAELIYAMVEFFIITRFRKEAAPRTLRFS